MPDLPLITIIITTYKRPELLDLCIKSALAQEYFPVEILVVEDGPTLETKKVILNYGRRVTYIEKAHSGIAGTRNVGCRAAKGEYIAFVDDDDLFHPRRLVRLYEVLQEYPEAVCLFSQGNIINEYGNETGAQYFNDRFWPKDICSIKDTYKKMLSASITVTPWSALFQRKAGERIGFFDEHFKHGCEDTDFFMRLCATGSFVCVPEPLAWVRGGYRESLTGDKFRMALSKLQLLEKHIQINRKCEKAECVRILKKREYTFIRQLLTNRTVPLYQYAKEHRVNLLKSFLRLPFDRQMYCLYLRYFRHHLKTE